MYLGITPVIMKDVSDTENLAVVFKKTGDAGWAMREVSNKYTSATNTQWVVYPDVQRGWVKWGLSKMNHTRRQLGELLSDVDRRKNI